jgi:DNA-binding beta-propeller fold protein YncE
VSPNGRFLYTANEAGVSPFAINPDGSLTPIACPGSSCSAGLEPFGLAVSPNGLFLYVTNYGSGGASTVSPFAINADGSLTPIACTPPNCNAGTGPFAVAVSPNGLFLYVTNSGSKVSPFAINPDGSLTPIACTPPGCEAPTDPIAVAVSPNGQFLYSANFSFSQTVSPFGINGNGSLTRITCVAPSCNTGADPRGVAVSPNGQFLYTANNTSDTVSPFTINADGSLTPIACPGTSCKTGNAPVGVAVSPGGRFLYVSNEGSTVSPFTINADGSLTPIACAGTSCNTGNNPFFQSLAISPDQAPSAAFTGTAGFAGRPTRIDGSGSSASPGQAVARYDWEFGDGSSAPNGGATPTHAYAAPGAYTVSLTVTDDAGCSTAQIFTGQTMSCNGGPSAHTSHQVTITVAPPNTKILKAKINSKVGRATFKFKAIGTASGFQCALAKKHRKSRFKKCKSPKTYTHLKTGRYLFEVRALDGGVKDPSPAKKKFRIK